jgi:ring-1,2-phenylacetyl-CoA epoxidase subunit PaaB
MADLNQDPQMDTQWPRYDVFELPREGSAVIHIGSVHAPDAEMAILNARDVFSRRPERLTMWVVRDRDIFSRTWEEIQHESWEPEGKPIGTPQNFHVFQKKSRIGGCVHVGDVTAAHSQAAMKKALAVYADSQAAVWWIIPASAVHKLDAEEAEVHYQSASYKPYRHEAHYPVRTMMRKIQEQQSKKDDQDD